MDAVLIDAESRSEQRHAGADGRDRRPRVCQIATQIIGFADFAAGRAAKSRGADGKQSAFGRALGPTSRAHAGSDAEPNVFE